MPRHLKESPGVHLNLMCKAISLQKKQIQVLTEIIDKQKVQLESLSGKVGVVEKFYGTHLIWKIDSYAVRNHKYFLLLNRIILVFKRKNIMKLKVVKNQQYFRHHS